MKIDIIGDCIIRLIVRLVGAMWLTISYNAIAYNFNLPNLTFFTILGIVFGLRLAFKKITIETKEEK